MNERGVEVLVAAAMRGQKQARGAYRRSDALCAQALLGDALMEKYGVDKVFIGLYNVSDEYGLGRCDYPSGAVVSCPECGEERCCEWHLIPHLNDGHEWDFVTIARKLAR